MDWLIVLTLTGLLAGAAGIAGVHPKPTKEICEKQAVPSSYLLGDQLLHKMQVKQCLSRPKARAGAAVAATTPR